MRARVSSWDQQGGGNRREEGSGGRGRVADREAAPSSPTAVNEAGEGEAMGEEWVKFGVWRRD